MSPGVTANVTNSAKSARSGRELKVTALDSAAYFGTVVFGAHSSVG